MPSQPSPSLPPSSLRVGIGSKLASSFGVLCTKRTPSNPTPFNLPVRGLVVAVTGTIKVEIYLICLSPNSVLAHTIWFSVPGTSVQGLCALPSRERRGSHLRGEAALSDAGAEHAYTVTTHATRVSRARHRFHHPTPDLWALRMHRQLRQSPQLPLRVGWRQPCGKDIGLNPANVFGKYAGSWQDVSGPTLWAV